MFLLRFLCILVSLLLIHVGDQSFAASTGLIATSGSVSILKSRDMEKSEPEQKNTDENTDTNTEEKKVEDKKKEQIIWKLTVETFKLQGNKILKDIDVSVERVYPDPKIRIEIYTSIQKTLEFRKQKLEKSEFSTEAKYIFKTYLEYMIAAIEKRKKNLE